MASDSEDDFCEFGTPLEPLDEDAIPRKKPFSLEEQVVTDEHGRRRFHGAFTGGFSAGFFNTVGSLEGWKPTAFKSSRREKGVYSSQTPADFMDDEDMGEFGIAPTMLQASQDYSNSNKSKRKHVNFSDGPIPGAPVLGDLLEPVRETVGIKLLKQMGWKPGQGVGPRVSKNEKQKFSSTMKKVYGCMLPPDEQNEEESDSDSDSELDWDNITFAPDDYEPFLCKPKDNCFGIGYAGLERRPILGNSGPSEIKFQEKNRKVHIRGQAFGVGAFEEEDEDIYTRDDMSQYDFTLEDAKKIRNLDKPSRWTDGVLEGFVPATTKPVKKYFPPPSIPKEFKATHKVRISRFEPLPVEEKRKDLGRHEMRSKDRSALLGETSDESASEAQKQARKKTEELVSNTPMSDNRFKPFVLNPEKQDRYEKYLKLIRLGKKDCLTDLQPITMTEWDKDREKLEFEQAARLFQPLTGTMGDRFTSASQLDDMSDPLAVVEKTKYGNEVQRNAAKMKMYGQLTRQTSEWSPSSILCKRFNIPEPHTSQNPEPVKKPSKFSIFDCLDAVHIKHSPPVKSEPEEIQQQSEKPCVPPASEAESKKVAELETEEAFTDPKEKIDLFKAIFLDTDDEEEKEEEKEKEREKEEAASFSNAKQLNAKRNTSPPRGLFENLDLEALAVRKKHLDGQEIEIIEEKVEEKNTERVIDIPDDAYGPKLPEKLIPSVTVPNQVTEVSNDRWVEKDAAEKKHKKKEKKHKKDKHKSKHKHKKHKR